MAMKIINDNDTDNNHDQDNYHDHNDDRVTVMMMQTKQKLTCNITLPL